MAQPQNRPQGKALRDFSRKWIADHKANGTDKTPIRIRFISLLSKEKEYEGESYPLSAIPAPGEMGDLHDAELDLTPDQLDELHMVILEDGWVVANGFGWPDTAIFGKVVAPVKQMTNQDRQQRLVQAIDWIAQHRAQGTDAQLIRILFFGFLSDEQADQTKSWFKGHLPLPSQTPALREVIIEVTPNHLNLADLMILPDGKVVSNGYNGQDDLHYGNVVSA